MARSIWKAPLSTHICASQGGKGPRGRQVGRHQDLVASFDHPAAVRRSDLRRLQWSQAHPGQRDREMIGQKFGEYSPTRTYYGHAADKKAKRK